MRLFLLGVVLCVSGCAYKVELTSMPVGARVELPDGSQVFTPEVVKVRGGPFRRQEITVSSPGYRSFSLRLRRATVRGHVELQLIPEHGPVGTWTTETEAL